MTLEERIQQLEIRAFRHSAMNNATNVALAELLCVIANDPKINKQQLFDGIAAQLRGRLGGITMSAQDAIRSAAVVEETRDAIEVVLSLFKTTLKVK